MNEPKAARYHRLRRRSVIGAMAAGALWLLLFDLSGAARTIADWAGRAAAPLPSPFGRGAAVALFAGAVAGGYELLTLPFVVHAGFVLDRRYGLSCEPFRTWLGDHLKALALGFVLMLGAAIAAYACMDLSPRWWWVLVTMVFGCAAILLAVVAPIALMPLFYRFRPLEREALRERLLALSSRAGVPVVGAFEWGLGAKTTRANAALVGIGHTRRILVSDTLLRNYTEDEIEVILAHELAHHVHQDLWTGLAAEVLVAGISLWAAARVVADASDLAWLPRLVLAGGAVSLLLSPLTNAWSRFNERRADRFALTLTSRPAAFISAMRRLGAQNLAEENPSTPVFWFFHTHPTIDERIEAAKRFDTA